MSEILVVDDKPEVRKNFDVLLKSEGYTVRTAANGDKALEAIFIRKPDLVLLDIDMPKRNGFSTCEGIRKFDKLLPIVFLTGFDTEINELRARELGADDFFSKSADNAVLLATIRRSLARAEAMAVRMGPDYTKRIVLGKGVVVDMISLDVFIDGQRDQRLTKTELDLLKALVDEHGGNLSTDKLIAVVRGEGYACEDAMLYMHMSNLRRKLGPAAESIVSIRGEGYHLNI